MKLNNKKELLKKALGVLWWGFTIALALLLISIIGAKLTGKVPSIFGYSVVNIISGSMEDEIPKGSYILIKKIDADEVKRGDVICFYSSDPTIYGMPNTHRVVEDPIKTDEGLEFVTRGDANLIADKVNAKGDRLIGIHVKNLDGLTAFSEFVSGNNFIFVIIGLQIAIAAMVAYNFIVVKRRTDVDGNVDENPVPDEHQKEDSDDSVAEEGDEKENEEKT